VPGGVGRNDQGNPEGGTQVKGSLFAATTRRWSVASALLVFALTGQAMAAKISGTVKVPEGRATAGSFVIATSDKFAVYRVEVAEDGTFAIDNAAPGTYTLSVIGPGMNAPDVKDVQVAEGKDVTQNFELKTAEPFCIVKSPNPIPLDQDIDSAAFADAPEILINGGKNVGVGLNADDPLAWANDGGLNIVNGRFKVKYSTAGLHIAADVNFKTPLVNNQVNDNLWNGNALEFDFQNDPYDPERTDKNKEHNWQVAVGLGPNADWWEHNVYNMRPRIAGQEVSIGKYITRVPKEVKDGVGGEKFRLDLPWGIFLQNDESGPAISMPEDNALGAMDIVLDASDPTAERSEAVRKYQVQWSGFGNSHWNASSNVPVKFCPQPPASAGG